MLYKKIKNYLRQIKNDIQKYTKENIQNGRTKFR